MRTPKQFDKLVAGIGVRQRRNATPQKTEADKLIGKSQRRDTTFDARELKLADDAQVISVTFSSDAPVYRNIGGFSFYEILDHSPQAAADFRMLNSGGQFIRNHDINQVMGVVEDGSAKIDSAIRKGCADLRFSERPEAQLERVDVLKGVRRNFSFDYEVTAPYIDTTKKISGLPVLRAMAWRVLSICTETHSADITVGHGPDRRAQQRGLGCSCACCTPGNPQPCCCCCPNLTSAPLSCNCACCQSYYPRPCCCCCDELSETTAQDAAEITAGERRRTKIMCNASSAAECQTHNCTLHPAAAKRAAQTPPTPQQIIATRQAELTGWAGVFGDTPEEVSEYTQLARDYARDSTKLTLEMPAVTDMFKAAIEKAKSSTRATVNTAKPPQGLVTVPGRRTSSLRVFKGEGGDLRAYRFWNGLLANAFYGRAGSTGIPAIAKAHRYAQDHGLLQRAAEGQSESDPEAGGFTVQEEWSPDTISLVEEFGVVRRYAKIQPMAAEAMNIRRREGGLQFHAAGEAEDVEVEKKKWGGNKLVAKKWLCLANITSELSEDSSVNQADDLAYEMALADSLLEDNLGFLADGTGSEQAETGFQGVVGIIQRILNVSATKANISGLVISHGTIDAISKVPLVLGDLRLGALLGDRSPLTITMSEHSSFRNDTIDLKGRVRMDFIAHSPGNADSDAKKRKAGPIVILGTDDWAQVTSDHLNKLMGILPRFPGIRPVFFCHQTFYFQVLRKILIAAGGATVAELAGAGPFQFGGYPVEFCQNLPSS
jgi:Phage capsid family